jgi:hypothetical protein
MGLNGFCWFQGVVEDRQDPLKLGRIRVRILGLNTEDKNLIPTEDLPWAFVMQPITSAAMNGIGQTPIGPVPGTWVFGFFRDGEHCQEPVIIGTVGGIPEDAAIPTRGFNDPRNSSNLEEKLSTAPRKIKTRKYVKGSGVTLTPEEQAVNYPRIVHPLGAILHEPDTNRLARNEKIDDTIIQIKKDNKDKGVPIAFGGSWDEPQTTYNAKYPYNHVEESESGHIKEVDDTPGFERTSEWNRSGTFEEIDKDGNKVSVIVKDNYVVIMHDDNIHIQACKKETIDGDYDLYTKGCLNIQVDGNVNLLVGGNAYQKINGDVNQIVGGNAKSMIGGNSHQTIKGDSKSHVYGDETVKIGGKLLCEAATGIKFQTGGKFEIIATKFAVTALVSLPSIPPIIPSILLTPDIPESPKK